jgi:ribosomal protein S18 acetylase RimI-like enzyme
MFFASHPDTESRQAALSAAIGRACDALGGMVLAQALLLPKEARAARAFGDAGFDVLADLGYLRWRPGRPGGGGSRTSPAEAWAAGVGAERFRADGVTLQRVSSLDGSARDRVLREALRQSYEGTLDCPALCRMRTVDDVLSSHRAVGVFDPSLWWVIESEGRPSGALLWSRTEGGGVSSAELVYMGLSPRLRGKGLGGKLLAFSREELTARGIAELTCAVDLANTPARNLYDRFGFRRWAVRRAFVRRLAG